MSFTSVDSRHLLDANRTIVRETLKHLTPSTEKVHAMQEIYLSRNPTLYSEAQQAHIRQGLHAVEFKNVLAHAHLEELWALSMDCRWSLVDLVTNSVDKQVWTDEEHIIGAMHLEAFVVQARAFLNVYMYYICLLMNIAQPGEMTRDKFKRSMKKVSDPQLQHIAGQMTTYFDVAVFGDGQWGKLVKDIRDKILHRESLRPSAQSEEVVMGLLLDWPTIRGMTFERFAQQFANGAFELLRSTTPILLGLEWKTGPFREGLWKT